MFEDEAEDVVRKVIEMAKGGNLDACKLVLERCAPRLRDEAPRRSLSLDSGIPIEMQAGQVIDALRTGELSADEAGALLQGLGRVAEMQRIGALADLVAILASRAGVPLPPELALRRQVMLTQESS